MSNYSISQIYPTDNMGLSQVDALLKQEGISRDPNLDYICGMYDDNYHIIATGGCFSNTLRCFAVDHNHQGEGLLNEIISHLIDFQYQRGNLHLFLYTKINTSKFFRDLGFYDIAYVDNTLVFMENRKTGFADYLHELSKTSSDKKSACIVMNANPFTLGHQYLVEKAASECDILHLFIVSEDVSLIPFSIRKRLVIEGVSHLPNVICHDSGSYIISNSTFPSYFLKDEVQVIKSHCRLDLTIFTKIAEALNITSRYVGDEPTSQVTSIYNQIMKDELPKNGIECHIIPRKEAFNTPISASTVRMLIKNQDYNMLESLLPASSLEFFKSKEAEPLIERIQKSSTVIHY